MNRPTLTEQDLRNAGWVPLLDRACHPAWWQHLSVRDGLPMSFDGAVRSEERRRKMDGGG